MVYNVNYEVAATLFLAIFYYYLASQKKELKKTEATFKNLALFIMLTNMMDVITAITISYGAEIPRFLNVILNTVFFAMSTATAVYFSYYVTVNLKETVGREYLFLISNLLLTAYATILFLNMFTGVCFYFDDSGKYIHGPMYRLNYAIPTLFILYVVVMVIINSRQFSKMQIMFIMSFVLFLVTGMACQMLIWSNVLLSYFAAALAVPFMLFAMETPDYRNLMNAKAELEKAQYDAQQANQAKSSFLADMSHEIRTPINVVLGMDEMVLRECQSVPIREYAYDIESAGRSLLSLIDDILDFSKIESGKMEILPSDYDLASLLNDSYMMISMRLKDKGLKFDLVCDSSMPKHLYGDEIRIRQILVNLLTNAVKYTSRGMVTLTANWKRIEDDKMLLMLKVKDTGMGIHKEDLDKIFQAYQRVEEQKNRNIEGTGLGLLITGQLVELMGGTVNVSSVVGEGSEFTVSIPQIIRDNVRIGDFSTQYKNRNEGQKEHDVSFVAPNAKILVVDDIPMNLKVVQGLLKDTKIKIDTANGGEECLSKVVEETYDIIFLDYMMPGVNGVEILLKMRDLEGNLNSSTPVIMLTANAIMGAKEEYISQGFDDYLSKPIEGIQLEEMLIKYLPEDKVESVLDDKKSDDDKASDILEDKEAADDRASDILEDKDAVDDSGDDSPEAVFKRLEKIPEIDVSTGIHYCGDFPDIYLDALNEYIKSGLGDELRKDYNIKDWKNYRIHAHALKGVSLNIGAKELFEEAKELEMLAKEENEEALLSKTEGVLDKNEELLKKLKKCLNV